MNPSARIIVRLRSQRSIHTPATRPSSDWGSMPARAANARVSADPVSETQVEDHGIAYDGAAQDGYSLSGPDDREYLFPVLPCSMSCFDPGDKDMKIRRMKMCGGGCAALLFWTCGESVCAAGRLRRDGGRAAADGGAERKNVVCICRKRRKTVKFLCYEYRQTYQWQQAGTRSSTDFSSMR